MVRVRNQILIADTQTKFMSATILKYALILLIFVCDLNRHVTASSHGRNHHHLHDGRDISNDFSNQWVVHLEGSLAAADLLAMKLGYKNLGEVIISYYVNDNLQYIPIMIKIGWKTLNCLIRFHPD